MYVQDLVLSDELAPKVYSLLVHEGAHVYVCGSVNLADGVRSAVIDAIAQEHPSWSKLDATRFVSTELKDKGLYHEDVYGVTSNYKVAMERVNVNLAQASVAFESAKAAKEEEHKVLPDTVNSQERHTDLVSHIVAHHATKPHDRRFSRIC